MIKSPKKSNSDFSTVLAFCDRLPGPARKGLLSSTKLIAVFLTDQGLCGFAIIQHGFARATEDIIWLIDTSPENFAKLEASMMGLPDGAVRDVNAEDCESPEPALTSTSVARQETRMSLRKASGQEDRTLSPN